MKEKSALSNILAPVIAVAFIAFAITVSTAELHVGPGQTYSTITDAVTAASEHDTIIVHDAGADPDYEENVDVNVEYLTIKEADGEDVTVKAASSDDHVLDVTADHVTIRGLDIYGAGGLKAGIYISSGIQHCTIENNRCGWDPSHFNSQYGIQLDSSSSNTLSGNTCNNNSYGIYLNSSTNNTLSDNLCSNINFNIYLDSSTNNTLSGNISTSIPYGIYLNFSNNNTLSGNICTSSGIYMWSSSNNRLLSNICNNNDGITLSDHCDNNTIWGNICNSNGCGIRLDYGLYYAPTCNTLSDNICDSNSLYGIHLWSSTNNNLSSNRCNNNGNTGIHLEYYSNGNTLSGNTCESNTNYGIYFNAGYNRTYLNTLSDNGNANVSVLAGWSGNTWCSSTTIYYSYEPMYKNYLGNYYSDYDTTGQDPDGDGIGNTPYDLPGDELADSFPLMATSDNYHLQSWWLHSNGMMYIDNMTKPGGSIPISGGFMKLGQVVWIADQVTPMDIDFTGGTEQTWTGQVVFTSAPASGHTFIIEIGSWDGSSFSAGGPDATLTGDGTKTTFIYETDNQPFTVTTGDYLALKIINNSDSSYSVRTGGSWSYISSPEGSMGYPTGVEEEFYPQEEELYCLSQNYPNPFVSQTAIYYQISEENFVSLNIYNVAGRLIITLVNEHKLAGSYRIYWNGKDEGGRPVSTGLYFYQLNAGNLSTLIRKMVLLR